ncbi:Glycosyl hydrolase-like 10 domain-containing protein [Tumidithrix helvetica PCC 7403]|uniref:family 10 glycosylhydrolase n=1 Tax=Tumidithrix helvetica TaxID=3457545 RepID=UPI003C80657A
MDVWEILHKSLARLRQTLKPFLPFLFLISFISVLLASSFAPWIVQRDRAPAFAQLPRQEIRGVWLTTNDFDVLTDRVKLQEAVTQLRQLNFNTIYPVVWNSGYVLYPSAVAQRTGNQPFIYRGTEGQDILAEAIAQAHRQALLVIPWFEYGFMAPPTSELVEQHPNWFTQQRDGSTTSISGAGEVMWLNPFHPEVQQFITDLVLETITQYDADGVQFDDHMSLPNEFGYDRYTIALYKQETKKNPPANPSDPAWMRWRANKITAFMVKLSKAVKARKPQAIFSVSPSHYVQAYNEYLQDWPAWVQQKAVDEIVMQVYRYELDSFLSQLVLPELQEAQKKVTTAVGILTGLRNSPVSMPQIFSQVRAAQERGLGVAFFYYKSLWDYGPEAIAERKANFQAFFPYPALRTAVKKDSSHQSPNWMNQEGDA